MITIRVNGKEYFGFTSAIATKDVEDFCGQFSFTATGYDFPINIQDECEIFVNGNKFLTGFIEKRNVSGSANDYTISVSGRDKLSLLVDNTISKSYQYIGGQTLSDFCQKLISDSNLNISVIAEKNPIIPAEDFPSCEIDSTLFEVIDDVCKRLQVIATSSPDGDLMLISPSSDLYPTAIINNLSDENNNVLQYSYTEDFTNRFNTYKIYSQTNFSSIINPLNEDLNSYDVVAIAQDDEINNQRKINIIMKNSYNESQASDYAKYTSNIRRVKSKTYQPTLLLHQGTEDGRVWEYNKLYNINDEFTGINTQMLCKSITYKYDNSGETTDLVFIAKDAFQVQASKPKTDRSIIGDI